MQPLGIKAELGWARHVCPEMACPGADGLFCVAYATLREKTKVVDD
jgi:hypothetical protein